MQNYTKIDLEKFKNLFEIKENRGESDKKYLKKAKKYIKLIKWIPGLQMVGVGNSISMNSSSFDSDIDLFIVTKPNTMWLNRILITFIFQIFFVRKTAKKHAGRFCLSFFSTTTGMDFYKFVLLRDPYLFFWILYFKPILNYENTYEKFIEINSKWGNFGDFSEIIEENKKEIINSSAFGSPLIKGEKMFGKNILNQNPPIIPFIKDDQNNLLKKIDNFLKKIFLPKTLKTYENLGKPFGVIINDDLLKFHNNDIRREVAEEFFRFTKI